MRERKRTTFRNQSNIFQRYFRIWVRAASAYRWLLKTRYWMKSPRKQKEKPRKYKSLCIPGYKNRRGEEELRQETEDLKEEDKPTTCGMPKAKGGKKSASQRRKYSTQ